VRGGYQPIDFGDGFGMCLAQKAATLWSDTNAWPVAGFPQTVQTPVDFAAAFFPVI
jgi:hypothetical protein